jgi:hypothetical protein
MERQCFSGTSIEFQCAKAHLGCDDRRNANPPERSETSSTSAGPVGFGAARPELRLGQIRGSTGGAFDNSHGSGSGDCRVLHKGVRKHFDLRPMLNDQLLSESLQLGYSVMLRVIAQFLTQGLCVTPRIGAVLIATVGWCLGLPPLLSGFASQQDDCGGAVHLAFATPRLQQVILLGTLGMSMRFTRNHRA